MPFLTYPLALIGLAAIPGLVAIYLLQNRFRREAVSSLVLWQERQRTREGGARVRRLRVPWLFLVELLILALLTAAAVDPRWETSRSGRPLVIVLDDSASMRARSGGESARDRGEALIERVLKRRGIATVRLVLAGARPQALGHAMAPREAAGVLDGWVCRSTRADMGSALTLALGLGGHAGRVFVVSDQAPARDVGPGVRWEAVGRPLPNVGFVSVARSAVPDGDDRCLLEVMNASSAAVSVGVVLTWNEDGGARAADLRLGASGRGRVVMEVPAGAGVVTARLAGDALDADNTVLLLRPVAKRVRVRADIRDEALLRLLEAAVESSGQRSNLPGDAQLVFVDTDEVQGAGTGAWVVRFLAGEGDDAKAFVGPFVVDLAHPLARGLSLDGVVWAAPQDAPWRGLPVITAGNSPLVTDQETRGGGHDVRVYLRPALSTVQQTPNWPILVWNLLAWRGRSLPGMRDRQARVGDDVVFVPPWGAEAAVVTSPAGEVQSIALHGEALRIRAAAAGVHRVQVAAFADVFAANLLSPEESDLTACVTGAWGEWLDADTAQVELSGTAASWALAALCLIALHAVAMGRRSSVAGGRGGAV